MALSEIAGIAAGLIGFLVGHVWYIYTITRGETTAHFLTWSLSAIMSGITLFFYTEAGAEDSVYVLWGDLIGFLMISVFAWKYRHESFKLITRENCLIALAALGSFVIYLATGDALVSLIAVIIADVLVLWPTIKKTIKFPEQEELIAWTGTMSGNVLNIFAIQGVCTLNFAEMNIAELIYVFSVLVVDGIVWCLILRKRIRSKFVGK